MLVHLTSLIIFLGECQSIGHKKSHYWLIHAISSFRNEIKPREKTKSCHTKRRNNEKAPRQMMKRSHPKIGTFDTKRQNNARWKKRQKKYHIFVFFLLLFLSFRHFAWHLFVISSFCVAPFHYFVFAWRYFIFSRSIILWRKDKMAQTSHHT